MKSILKTLRPIPVANILNGKQTVIVCKNFPKDYVGWVYICCTKTGKAIYALEGDDYRREPLKAFRFVVNGKIVARFWCDKVEDIKLEPVEDYSANTYEYMTETLEEDDLLEKSCLHTLDLSKYLQGKNGYAIHISKLEVFDRPRYLSEFKPVKWNKCGVKDKNGLYQCKKCPYGITYDYYYGECNYKPLTKAPQNYCYIESEEK